jgi:hypothetical protein
MLPRRSWVRTSLHPLFYRVKFESERKGAVSNVIDLREKVWFKLMLIKKEDSLKRGTHTTMIV